MHCSKFLQQLEIVAASDPSVDLPPELYEHQKSCRQCRQQVESFRDAWLMLPASLEPKPIHPNLEARVMDRITNAPIPKPSALASNGKSNKYTGLLKYVLAASVLVALLANSRFGRNRPIEGLPQDEIKRIEDIARQMDKLDRFKQTFGTPELHYVSLSSSNARVKGYLVYDSIAKESHFFGFGLTPSPGRTYLVWLMNSDGAPVSSAIIVLNSDSLGAAIVDIPNDISEIAEAIVSVESDPDVSSPSSDIRMRAKIDQ